MKPRSWPALPGFILLVTAVSTLGGAVTATSVSGWYVKLDKPAWTPPGWLFGPVWTLLYAMMAVVAWRLWTNCDALSANRVTLRLWFLQLALNCLWSLLFFGLRSPVAGLLDIAALLVVILWIQIRLPGFNRVLACLWSPYVLWTGFAAALNLSIWLRLQE